MDISFCLLVASVVLVVIGVRLMVKIPAQSSPQHEENGPSVTVSGNSAVVTVRNAAGGDFKVFFGNQHSEEEERVIPYSGIEDKSAEEEVTILDELRNPDTSPIRKAEIETELMALGYRIVPKPEANQTNDLEPQGQIATDNRPQQKPSSDKPSEKDDSDDNNKSEGMDEGLGEQEPNFESYHVQSD